jgi:rare lipoprotein A
MTSREEIDGRRTACPISSRRVTVLADRYTGRHIRQARHGAWINKKRSRSKKPNPQLLPAAAALTVAGFLVGGASAAIQLSPVSADADLAPAYDPADIPPPDRNAQPDRASRIDARNAAIGNGLVAEQPEPAPAVAVLATGSCVASYNDRGQTTASGEAFDPGALTAAHKSLPFNSLVRVTNPANGESVVVRINDRGPFHKSDRCLDLTSGAFAAIADPGQGIVDVRYEVLAQDAT